MVRHCIGGCMQMKTPPLTRVQSRAVKSGGNNGPLGLTAFLPAVALGLTDMVFVSVTHTFPRNWRGLNAASLFGATSKINDVAWFSSLSERRGATSTLPYGGRASFFLKVLHQISDNLFKAFHKFIPFLTSKLSSGEKQWDYKNQTMRLSK